jgi:histidine triad (HIT) family protein
MDSRTIFEKIIARDAPADILFEDETAVVVNDINPQAPVHVLIVPKRKIPRVAAAVDDDCETLGKLLLVAKNFASSRGLDGFRLVINNGIIAGETVPHLHIHLLAGRTMAWPPG